MARYQPQDEKTFGSKVIENYKAGEYLFKEGKCNAAASRLYYSFVLLGLRNAAMYGEQISEDCYFDPRRMKVDKGKIKNNAKGLKIQKCAEFKMGMNSAESARIQADYFPASVESEQIEGILPKLGVVLRAEGMIT